MRGTRLCTTPRRSTSTEWYSCVCVCVCVISPLRVALVGVAPVQCVGVGSLKDGLSNSFLCSSTTFAVITAILMWLWP